MSLALLWLSDRFAPDRLAIDRDPVWLVVLLTAAGGLYLLLPPLAARCRSGSATLGFAVLLGLAMRLAMLPSTPILEDDYYRYLWDGGLVAHGASPYRSAPAEIGGGPHADLAERAGGLIERINHPNLRTIYPPVAQIAFALAHWLIPWDLTAWRGLLIAFDLISLALLVTILRQLGRSPFWALIYWWNPLVVMTLFNAGHMDGLLLPFLLWALLLMLRGRPLWATAGLVLAAGVKLWPVLLLPMAWRTLWPDRRALAAAMALAFVGLSALAIPVLAGGLDGTSGFVAYGQSWAMNDAFFLSATQLGTWLLMALGVASVDPAGLVRALIAAGLLALSLRLARDPPRSQDDLIRRVLILVAALFLTLPAQFPWYYVWVLPFLSLRPSWALLLPSVLLPLYYLRFPLAAAGREALFDHLVVWLEWLPVWGLLVLTWLRSRGLGRIGLAP